MQYPSSDGAIRIPIAYAGLIYLDVRVNGSEPLRFLLDTGSSWTFLDSAVAKSLSIATGGGRSAWAAGDQPLQMTFAHDLRLGMGEAELRVPEAAVADLRGKPFVGVIGSDLLQRYVVDLNYSDGTLILYDPAHFQYDGKGTIIPFTLQERLPLLRLQVTPPSGAAVVARMMLDTGAPRTVAFTRPFAARHHLLDSTKSTIRLRFGSLGGGTVATVSRVAHLSLGPLSFENVIADLSEDTLGAQATERRDGVLGNRILARFSVVLDYPGRRLIIAPREALDVPFDYETTGLWIETKGRGFRVSKVLAGTAASEGGFKEGDVLVSLDGLSVHAMTLTQVRQRLRMDGRSRPIVVQRDSSEVALTLTTSRID